MNTLLKRIYFGRSTSLGNP